MICRDLTEKLDDYIDATLSGSESARLEQHLSTCETCQQRVDDERQMLKMLREYGDSSVPVPDNRYFRQALLHAEHAGRQVQHKRSWMTGFGSAVAAGLAIWVLNGLLVQAPDNTPAISGVPAITMALAEPRTVNLVFSSASNLDDATLTVLLPDGVELEGFEGRREITWMTDLRKGKNLLPLQLIASAPMSGELLATLKHGADDKTFRLHIDVG